MGWGKGWAKSLLGNSAQLGMMALCEVINYDDRKNKHSHHYKGNYVVAEVCGDPFPCTACACD